MEEPSLKTLDTIAMKSFVSSTRRHRSPVLSSASSSSSDSDADGGNEMGKNDKRGSSESGDDAPGMPTESPARTANTRSGLPPGPNPRNRSLHPGRSRPAKSSLGLSKKALAASQPPAGIKNSGETCFGASLLQILLRRPEWEHAHQHASRVSEGFRRSELAQLLGSVHQSLHTGKTQSFPMLNKILATTVKQSVGQHDPSEILRGLLAQLDELCQQDYDSRLFQDLFASTSRQRHQCSACSRWSFDNARTSQSGQSETILRAVYMDKDSGVPDMIARSMDLSESFGSRLCSYPECAQSSYLGLETQVRIHGDLLAVEVAYPYDTYGKNIAKTSTDAAFDAQFRLRPRMQFGGSEWGDLKQSGKLDWVLAGVVCRVGTEVDTGHYCSIVEWNSTWWSVDDAKVTKVGTILDAFNGLRRPRLLVYTRDKQAIGHGKGTGSREPTSDGPAAQANTNRSHSPAKKPSKSQNRRKRPPAFTPIDDISGGPGQEPGDLKRLVSAIDWTDFDYDLAKLPIRQKPDGLLPPPSFDLRFDNKSTGVLPWMYRYLSVRWTSRRGMLPLISARPHPHGLMEESAFDSIRVQAKELKCKGPLGWNDMKILGFKANDKNREGWYGTTMINSLCQIMGDVRGECDGTSDTDIRGVFAGEFLCYATLPECKATQGVLWMTEKFGPAPFLQHVPNWRSLRSVAYLASDSNTHWMAAVIFGPERL
jgi:ubiquitin C-terminal hydrolase